MGFECHPRYVFPKMQLTHDLQVLWKTTFWISIHGSLGDWRVKAVQFDCTKYHRRASVSHINFRRDDTDTRELLTSGFVLHIFICILKQSGYGLLKS